MPGLTDRASGEPTGPGREAESARQRWEESMLRQLEELRLAVRRQVPEALAARCGAVYQAHEIRLAYWDRQACLDWPALEAHWMPEGNPASTYDTAVLLYYLRQADGSPMADRWIGYRDLPGGTFYNQAFQGYSGDRLAGVFGQSPEAFDAAARALAGLHLPALAEHAYAFQPLPRIRLAAVLWPGDEEFPARASVLFDAAAAHYMTTDGLALLGSGLVGRLIKHKP